MSKFKARAIVMKYYNLKRNHVKTTNLAEALRATNLINEHFVVF